MSTIKIKPTQTGTEYLNDVPMVSMNQSFLTDLNSALGKIDENFKRIISLPFLQGDNGNSIFEEKITVSTNTVQGSELSKAICNKLYGSDTPNLSAFGGIISGVSSWDNVENAEVVFYRHRETTENSDKFFYSAKQLFIVLDARLKEFNDSARQTAIPSTFADISCALTITGTADADAASGRPDYDTVTFNVNVHSIIPTLYYDQDRGYWCWSINGQPTTIPAQGLVGEPGANSEIVICKGEKIPQTQGPGQIKIVKVLQAFDEESETSEDSERDAYDVIREGTLVLAWFTEYTDQNTPVGGRMLNNCIFGIARKSGEAEDPGRFAYFNILEENGVKLDFATAIKDLSLYRSLFDISNTDTSSSDLDEPSLRGLFIPVKYEPAESQNQRDIHMAWSNLNPQVPILGVGCVKMNNAVTSTANTLPGFGGDDAYSGNDPRWKTNSALELWYPKLRHFGMNIYKKLDRAPVPSGGSEPSFNPAGAMNIYDYSDSVSSTNSYQHLNYAQSVIELKQSDSRWHDLDEDAAYLTKTGLYINRTDYNSPSTFPAVAVKNGNTYFDGGSVTVNRAKVYIGLPSTSAYTDSDYYFDKDAASAADENDFNSKRWKLDNPGVKLFRSDAIIHGGKAIISSVDRNRAIMISGNKMMFDYQVKRAAPNYPATNRKDINHSRVRDHNAVDVQIGGYNTVYNSITSNSRDNNGLGGAKVLDYCNDSCKPIILTPKQNREFTFLSGKCGYSAQLHSWGNNDVPHMDPTSASDETSSLTSENCFGLLSSFDCIWTKVGNVVDVKGKIYFNKVKCKVSTDPDTAPVADWTTVKQITYGELFRHIKEYGARLAFPLPVVLNNVADDYDPQSNPDCITVSVGNNLDNKNISVKPVDPTDGLMLPALIDTRSGCVSTALLNSDKADQDYNRYGDFASADMYHNNMFNGSAQFHFYGTRSDGKNMIYNKACDDFGPIGVKRSENPGNSASAGLMPPGIDVLNNVFTVTADISKCPPSTDTGEITYDDKYWCLSGIPNYDSINYNGDANITKQNYSATDTQGELQSAGEGPLRIVSRESFDSNTVQHGVNLTGSRYLCAPDIIGLRMIPYIENSYIQMNHAEYQDQTAPQDYSNTAGRPLVESSSGETGEKYAGASPITATATGIYNYLMKNFLFNLNSYKLSLNIGAYFIRNLTFSFSYVLDDDIQVRYAQLDSSDQKNPLLRTNQVDNSDRDNTVWPL